MLTERRDDRLAGFDDLDAELPAAGHAFGRYTDFRLLARGRSTVVETCLDRVAGRVVAMKRVLPDAEDYDGAERRLLREARVTLRLAHPNTVPAYEIGRDPDGRVYFTMKRIAGRNFADLLAELAADEIAAAHLCPVGRRMEIVADVCQALAYAHARRIVHRDVKPANIWVGDFGEVILLDWGLAKRTADRREDAVPPPKFATRKPDDLALTRADELVGTPLYMSPEQVRGRADLDGRSDVFAVGSVLYEALTSVAPFAGRDMSAVFVNVMHEPPPPPHERAPDRGIPEEASLVTLRALAKNPAERYGSALDLADELRMAARLTDR